MSRLAHSCRRGCDCRECCPRKFSLTMPNDYNFSFDLLYFHVMFVSLFLPCFAQLYGHLLQSRARWVKKKQA